MPCCRPCNAESASGRAAADIRFMPLKHSMHVSRSHECISLTYKICHVQHFPLSLCGMHPHTPLVWLPLWPVQQEQQHLQQRMLQVRHIMICNILVFVLYSTFCMSVHGVSLRSDQSRKAKMPACEHCQHMHAVSVPSQHRARPSNRRSTDAGSIPTVLV